MGWFGNIIKGATKFLGSEGAGGSLLSAAMPWGKAIGFIGGAMMTYDAVKKDREGLRKKRRDAKLGQADAIANAAYSAEDYRVDKGLLGQKFDLKQEGVANQYGARSKQVDQAAGATQLQTGEVNKMKDQVTDAYQYQTDSNMPAYASGTNALSKDLRKDLEGYANTYNMLSQYTSDRSHNFMEAYKGLLS